MYDAVADLPVRIDDHDLGLRERPTSSGFTRATTTVTLRGAGHAGRGEDVTYEREAHHRAQALDLDLAGEYTLEGFSAHLEDLALWPAAPDQDHARHYRRWGFESAALDLALRQAGQSLGEALDRTYDPVRFVVSTRLDDEDPTADRVLRWLDIDPDLEFKLDPTPAWDDDLLATLADTGAVRTLDLKAHYEGTEVDTTPDPDFYRRVLSAFPDAIVEDPGFTPETRPVFVGERDRLAWDYPVTGVDAIEALPVEPRVLNCKPSRFGTVESLLDTIAYCEREGIALYGGGQFELGVGRRQIQELAALCYPDGPNDVAPPGYNDPDPREGLPSSPLDVPADAPGFGR